MNSITQIENGVGFSQPSFGLFTQSTAAELGSLSNGMNLETEGLSLMGTSMTYYRSGSGSGSGSSCYVGSPSSNSPASYSKHTDTLKLLLQRSIISHSLYKGNSEEGAVRKVHSASDLMGRVDGAVSISKENSMIIEGMMKVSRYSPEEKRERIERYRSKRNLRNFKKKIQYDCRKILADTRRRSKGRFMRNDEIATRREDNHVLNDQYSSTRHHHHIKAAGDEYKYKYNEGEGEGEENSWINLLDYSFPCQYQ